MYTVMYYVYMYYVHMYYVYMYYVHMYYVYMCIHVYIVHVYIVHVYIVHVYIVHVYMYSCMHMYMFCPICQSGQFANWPGQSANCAAQSAIYPEICLICKLSQPISIHNMKVSNIGRQKSEILTIVMSVNIFHGRRLPVMFASCHNLCRISSFNTRYFGRNH